MTIYKPWVALSHYAPSSNLVFANTRELAARSKNGGLIVYGLAATPENQGREPQCSQPRNKGPILAVGYSNGFLMEFVLLDGGNNVASDGGTFDVAPKVFGKPSFTPMGYPNPIPPLQYGCKDNSPWLEYVTMDSDGTLAVLEILVRGRLVTFGPSDVATFGTIFNRAGTPRVVVVSREPKQWRVVLRGRDGRTQTIGREGNTAHRAFLGFGGHVSHPDFGLVALELGNNLWTVLCIDEAKNYFVPDDMQVVGVTSHPQHPTPGLVMLASDKRTIVVMGYNWMHILPTSSSEIESVTVSTFASHIAYKTIYADICVYSLAFEASVYDLKMKGVTYHENPQRHVRVKSDQPKGIRRRNPDPSDRPWFANSRFVPASNLTFVKEREIVARAANGTLLCYSVANHRQAYGGRTRIHADVPQKCFMYPDAQKPKIYQSWLLGEIAAVAHVSKAMLGVKFPSDKNVVVLETIGKGAHRKLPVGEYWIQSADVPPLPRETNPIVSWPLAPCYVRRDKRGFELVTVHPSGTLVRLTDNRGMRSVTYGPERVVAFDVFQSGPQPCYGFYVMREPTKWVITSVADARLRREIACTEDAPETAFIGFPPRWPDRPPELIAVPVSPKRWVLSVDKRELEFTVPPSTRVVGATRCDNPSIPPSLVVLEKDHRTITLLGQKWKHHFPTATSDIVQVKVQSHNELIVYVTELGEVVALKGVFPDPLVLLSPKVER